MRARGAGLVIVAAVLLVPAELALAYAREDDTDLWIFGSIAIGLVGYPWVYGALIATLARRGRSPLEPYGRTVDRLAALVVSSFVASAAILLGLVALIAPGLILAARWSAAGPLLVLDRHGPIGALEASNVLVRGRTRPVLGAGLLVFVPSLVIASPGLLVAELTESPGLAGLGNALFDIVLLVPLTAFALTVHRQTKNR